MLQTALRLSSHKHPGRATQDIVGGHVAGGFLSLSFAAPLARTGALRILGVAGRERAPTGPELPTLAEQGLAGFEAELWFALLTPAGTPPDIIERYSAVINEIVREPAIVELAREPGRRNPRRNAEAVRRVPHPRHGVMAEGREGSRYQGE